MNAVKDLGVGWIVENSRTDLALGRPVDVEMLLQAVEESDRLREEAEEGERYADEERRSAEDAAGIAEERIKELEAKVRALEWKIAKASDALRGG